MKPLISIVIPIYNVERYLNQCIESVINQEYSNIEIILVDDGSTDNCAIICDEYMNLDKRVKVIHKSNGGLSDARNTGVNLACGEYIIFLDSDDYWSDNNCLDTVVNFINSNPGTDILVFGSKLLYEFENKLISDGYFYKEELNSMKNLDLLRYLVEQDLLVGSACTKVIKKSFLVQNNLYFKVGIKSEDIEWLIRVCKGLPNMKFINYQFYIYRKMRVGSISSSVDFNHLKSYIAFLKEHAENDFKDNQLKKIILSYIAYQFTIICALATRLNKKDKKLIISDLKSFKYIMDYDLHPKVKKVNKLYKVIGFNNTLNALGLYLKIR